MAQNRRLAERQHGCHPSTALRGHRVPDGIYAAVDAMQAPGPNPPLHGPSSEAELLQLPPGDPAVLAVGERRDREVTWST